MVRLQQKLAANADMIPPGASAAAREAALDRRRSRARRHALEQALFGLRAAPCRGRAAASRSSRSAASARSRSSAASDVSSACSSTPSAWPRIISHRSPSRSRCRPPTRACRPGRSSRTTASTWSRPARSSRARATWATSSSGAAGGRPVFLRDVASILDGPEEPSTYVRFGAGAAAEGHERAVETESRPRRDDLGREAQGTERDHGRRGRRAEDRRTPRDADPGRRRADRHARLRRDGRARSPTSC